MGAVNVSDDRNWPFVRNRALSAAVCPKSAVCATGNRSGRVGPVQGLVDGQQVGQVIRPSAEVFLQVVDPVHFGRPVNLVLDCVGRVVELRIKSRRNSRAAAQS